MNQIEFFTEKIKAEESLEPFKGMQSRAMKIISNLCYRNTIAYDYLLLNKNRLGDILKRLKLDFIQPGLQEWALLTVRHLCEGKV